MLQNSSDLAEHANMVAQIKAILEQNPAGKHFRLLAVGQSISLEEDEIFIQTANKASRTIEIRPIKIDDFSVGDNAYDGIVVNPNDEAYVKSLAIEASGSKTPKYLVRFTNGEKIHVYD